MGSKGLFVILLTLALVGCANTPPSCDGSNRRPINQPSQTGLKTNLSCGSHATA